MTSTRQLPDEATLLARVVIGSQLHGLQNENSDTDYRGVFIHDPTQLLGISVKLSDTYALPGDNADDTAYELRHFIKQCVSGHPRALEVLYSNKIDHELPAFAMLRRHRHLLLDSRAIYEAHANYAARQANKISMFKPDPRDKKFAAAAIVTCVQGIQLLKTGDFKPQLADYDKAVHDALMHAKHDEVLDMTLFTALYERVASQLTDAYKDNMYRFDVDNVWLDDFIHDVYVNKHGLIPTEEWRQQHIDDQSDMWPIIGETA